MTSRGRDLVTSDRAGAGDRCSGANASKAYMLTQDWRKLHAEALQFALPSHDSLLRHVSLVVNVLLRLLRTA